MNDEQTASSVPIGQVVEHRTEGGEYVKSTLRLHSGAIVSAGEVSTAMLLEEAGDLIDEVGHQAHWLVLWPANGLPPQVFGACSPGSGKNMLALISALTKDITMFEEQAATERKRTEQATAVVDEMASEHQRMAAEVQGLQSDLHRAERDAAALGAEIVGLRHELRTAKAVGDRFFDRMEDAIRKEDRAQREIEMIRGALRDVASQMAKNDQWEKANAPRA